MATETNGAQLTPDFYDYPWSAPESVALDGRFVVVRWADGAELRAFDLWLVENAAELDGFDPATREGLVDPGALDVSTRVEHAGIAADGSLRVMFAGAAAEARYHPGWLHHVAERKHLADAWLPEARSWTAADLDVPPTHHGPSVLADAEARRAWLNDLLRWGLARLRGLPTELDTVLDVCSAIGAVRETNFGRVWDVKADISLAGNDATNSTANSNLRLGPHTDLPTRETPPGFQMLHCLENGAQGGESTMADGAAVVEHLRQHHPEYYDVLRTRNWIFFNRGPNIDHRWSGPFIDEGLPGSPLTLRAFYPVRAFPDMAEADMPLAYEAMACFSRLAADDRFQLRFPFEPGDLIAFDNRRILHGREAYRAGGRRHLRGAYIDHDEIRSAARVANRRHDAQTRQQESSHA